MDQRTSLEMTEMERRAFLRSMGLSAAVLLETAFPTIKPGLLSNQYVASYADRLAALRRLDGQYGPSAVAVEAAQIADSLLHRLKTTPTADPVRQRLALVTGEAASLAAHTGFHLGESNAGRAWARVVEEVGRQSRSADLTGWGVYQQAFYLLGSPDRALEYLRRTPRDGMSAPIRAKVEQIRSLAAAVSNHPFQRRDRWARNALDRAQDAVTQIDADPSRLPFVWWVGARNHDEDRGRCYYLLGNGEAAYEMLVASLREYPAELHRGLGVKHLDMARAALLSGEVEQACEHAGTAYRIVTETTSVPHIRQVRSFREIDLAPYAGSAGVRRLDEQFGAKRATPEAPTRPRRPPRRYIKVYGRDGTWRLHMVDCPDGLRATRRHPFPSANGRRPERLAANPQLRPGVVPCERCIGPLWS